MEADSILMLAAARRAELQAEVEYYRSGRQPAALVPPVSALVIVAARRLWRVWGERLVRASIADRPGSERNSGRVWRQLDDAQRGC